MIVYYGTWRIKLTHIESLKCKTDLQAPGDLKVSEQADVVGGVVVERHVGGGHDARLQLDVHARQRGRRPRRLRVARGVAARLQLDLRELAVRGQLALAPARRGRLRLVCCACVG